MLRCDEARRVRPRPAAKPGATDCARFGCPCAFAVTLAGMGIRRQALVDGAQCTVDEDRQMLVTALPTHPPDAQPGCCKACLTQLCMGLFSRFSFRPSCAPERAGS